MLGRMDEDCDLDALKETVLDAKRAWMEYRHERRDRAKREPAEPGPDEQETRLWERYREARDEWAECVGDVEDARRYGL